MLTPRILQTSVFSHVYRKHANYLTVRAGSTHNEIGGTIHNVTGGFYHGNYEYNYDYDVAVLRVRTDFDIAREIEDFITGVIVRLKRDGTRAENRFRLRPKRTSPFKSAGASVQSTARSRGVRISISKAGYTTFRGSIRVLATHSIRQFPLQFPSMRHRVLSVFKPTLQTVQLRQRSCRSAGMY